MTRPAFGSDDSTSLIPAAGATHRVYGQKLDAYLVEAETGGRRGRIGCSARRSRHLKNWNGNKAGRVQHTVMECRLGG